MSYDIEIYLAVSVWGLQGKKIPGAIKKLNKALGLSPKSEVLWDILDISGNSQAITGNSQTISGNSLAISNLDSGLSDARSNISDIKGDIDYYHPPSNCSFFTSKKNCYYFQ